MFYGTLAGALAYHEDRGNVAWSAGTVTDPQREAALLRASEALDGIYGPRFPGKKATRTQERAWPRVGAVDHCADEPIPEGDTPAEIETAAYALALAELQSPGSSTPTLTLGKSVKRQKVGNIEREFFSPAVPITLESLRPVLTAVEDALRCILTPDTSKGGTFTLDRF
ncbi:DnaT-like ssDNA-binding protein [Ensifer adhaerens]|uniref:DnaT-like ssDNA-binding protein n=1 Tax=Ensifer adhaerens TaxID=106592 RepID=UPI00384DFB7D